MAVDWSQFKPVSGPVDWSQFKPYEEKKEGAFARAGRIARDEDGGVLAAAGSLIEAALPDSRAGRDTTVAALKSAVGVPQSAIGLIDIASGGRFGRALEQAGIDPNAAQRALDELYSPETQAAKREVQAAEGFTDTAGAMLRNPSTILTGIGESIAPMLAGGVVGRGAAALSSRLSPAAAAAIGEGALMAGQSASQIRGQTEDGLLTPTQSALAAGAGVVGGLIGRAGGALSNRAGIGDVDTAIVQGGLAEAAKRPGFLARTALGAGIEGGVEEMPQSIVEQAAQNVALGKPWDEGLGSAAAQGLVVGAPFGAVGANLSRPAAAPEPAPAADPLDAQADRFRAATDAYLKDKPGADTIADVVSQPTVDAAIDALGAASPSMDEILAGKRQRAAQRVAEELGFADQVDARSPEQIMADAAARREQAALAAQQELGLSPTSAGAAPDPRTAEQIVADFEARRQAAVEQLQGAPAGQAPRTEQDFAARRREAALAAISDMGESLPRFRYTPALQGNKQEVASTEPDLVGTYVQQMRETNTPAARAFVQLYESGRITDQDVSDTIARQNPQLQAPAEPAIPSNATPLQAEGIQIEQMRRRAAPTLDLKQPEQAVAERAQAQRAEGDATPELTQQRLEAAAAQGRQQDPMTPVQVGQYIDALRLENTPQARALVQEYEAGRVTDQDVADAVNAQRRYQLGGVDLAQNRIETAATRGAQQAPGLQVERSGARAPNAALAEAVQMYGDMPLTARDMTVEGASERLSRAAAQARQTPESLIQVGDTTQTSRVPFRGRNEAIRTSNEGLDAAATGRGGERMTAPRPTLIGGKPPGSYTDQQLKDLVGNDLVPAITRRGAETELAVRALQQRAQAPAAPAAPGTTSPGGIILASAKRSPQDVLSSVARSRESKVGRPVQMTVVDTNTLPAQRGAARGALSKQAHTIIESVSRVFGKKLVVFESDDATAPDGFYSRDDPDTIYLNRNSEMPHLVVFGHELLHSLRKDNEAAYQALVKTIKLKEGADISETPGIRGDIEEFTADLMGNQFRDNEFWVATFRDIIASKGEQQGRQVVTRLAAAAVRAVNGLMKALGRAPGYNTDEMVANLGEVKTALRSALSTYAKDRYGAAVAMERERVAAAPAPAPAAAAAPATTVAPTATEDAQASEKRVEGPFKPARTMSELEGVRYSLRRADFVSPEDRQEVSTTRPVPAPKKGRTSNAYDEKWVIDGKDVRASKKHVDAVMRALREYNTLSGKGNAPKLMQELHDVVVENLLWLHDLVPENVRARAKLWYDGANRIANDWTSKYGVSLRQSSGVLAVLSPQMDWFKNVSLGERVISIWKNRQNEAWSPAMTDWLQSWVNASKDVDTKASRQAILDEARPLQGMTLAQMNSRQAALYVRAFDETYYERQYRLVTPEGGFGEYVTNSDDGDASVTWGGFDTIEKAISILNDGSFRNVEEKLGDEHKVRNFYNNIINPGSADGHVTIDTHAVAAALVKALSGSSREVTDNFGAAGQNAETGASGTYGLFADAYRDAAVKRGILPREMQSITWEAVRALFPASIKDQLAPQVDAVWDRFRKGEITRDQAREEVRTLSGGIRKMAWEGSDAGAFAADGGSSFNAEIAENPADRTARTLPPEVAKDKLQVNLSANTSSVPGIAALQAAAAGGDMLAHRLIQDIALDNLRHLLSGTSARVKADGVTGLYGGYVESGLSMTVTFADDDRATVLAALAKFADNFNQEQVHVRRGVKAKPGTAFDDGSYATPVYRWELKKPLSRKQIENVISGSGLYGLTFGDNFVEAYYVGDPSNEAARQQFDQSIDQAGQLLGRAAESVGRSVERLWAYGDSERGLGFERIRGDVPPGAGVSSQTANRVAGYLNAVKDKDGRPTLGRVKTFEQAEITPEQDALQTRIAEIYQSLPDNDLKNPNVRKAYGELAKEVLRQFNALPVKVEVLTGQGEPYKNSAEMRRDVLDNNHLFIFGTTPETFGPPGEDFTGHPLLENSGLSDQNGQPLLYNDLLRAVHDYYAHTMSPTQFGPKGEEAAWKNHMSMTNNMWARWALTIETRGQNSWVNFRPDLERSTPISEREFARQKAALLPVEYSLTGNRAVDKPMKEFIDRLGERVRQGSKPAKPAVKASEKRQTETPEFKAWFGDSKVVDENGQPLVVYHGSKWSSITSFDFKPRGFADLTSEPSARMPGWEEVRGTYTRDGKRHLIAEWMSAGGKVLVKYAGGMEILDTRGRSPTAVVFSFMNPREPISDRVAAGHRAAFFSENPEYTGFYSMWGARDGEDAPTTYPVYLRIENPVLPKHWATFEPFYREATKGDQAKLDLAKQAFMNERWEAKEAYPGFIEYAISKGFDGYANVEGGASAFAVSPVTEMAPGGVRTWAVFRPTQVKSAIGNRGAFDLTNPDIRASEKRQTNTPEFKRWFGDSKVVDENGEPLVVYHGTLGDFDEFDLAQFGKGDDGVAGRAFYFSNFTSVASDYAMTPPRGRPDGANVMPVYLSAKNPLVWDYFSSEGKELQRLREQFGPDGFAKWAQQRGYDSVKIIGNLDGEENAVQWAVFRPEQIKSAIGNRGTFDPANADIRASEKRQVNTPEFKRWFGDSKVVDENGNPLVVYTGTSKDVDFTKFKVPKNGVWFTTDPQEASMYAMDNDSKDLKYNPDTRRYDEVNTASRVMPTFLRIENPATLSEADSQAMRFASNYRKAQGLIFDRLRAQGYDGVDMGDGVWVVIGQPAQIKSAIGNRGTFDPANADIRASEKRQTNTPEFKAWFGDSKVVDENGEPLVVYHGAPDISTLTAFSKDMLGATTGSKSAEKGFFFVDLPEVASQYAGLMNESQRRSAEKLAYQIDKLDEARYDAKTPEQYRAAEARYQAAVAKQMPVVPEAARAGWTDMFGRDHQQRYGEGSGVLPVYLSLQNPMIVEQGNAAFRDTTFNDLLKEAKRKRHDGLIIRNTDDAPFGGARPQTIYVAFRPTQIKSAIGNRGTFDPANADIRASDKRNIFNQRIQPAWSVAPDTKLDAFLYKLQDKQIDLKRITQAIKDAIGGLAEKWDAYLAEELYHGRTAKQTKDFLQDEMKPLVDAMTANRVTMPELEEYLHNRHAEERNRQIATINPNLPDAGSGIATADARRYLAGLPANQRQRYEALARQVDAINKKTRQLLVSSGLEKQDTIDAWERTYPTYMPLFREDADYDGSQSPGGTGMGFSVRGPSSKRATGSADREVVDILANVALMRERTITRAEKARVGRALYGLAVQNPNPGFWLAIDPKTPKDIPGAVNTLISMGMTAQDARNLMQQPTVPYVDPRTGLVTYRVNPLLRNAEHVMSVRVDGEDKMLVFNPRDERAQRMVTSLKNLDAQQLGGALSAAAFVSRWFAQVNTQYNPVFGAINLIRDVGGAAFNLTTTDIADRKAQVMAGVGPALVGIYQDLRKNRTGQRSQGQWAQLWEEFQREGGQTGFRDMFSRSDERAVALQRMLDPSSWAESPLGKFFTANGTLKAPMEVVRKGAAPVFNWLSDYNETLENAVRLSAYKAAKDKGLSNAKAASIAKNLTVNFNRKGQVGVQMGALYAFFNASVQGTARLAETLGSGRDPNASAYSPNRYMGKTGQRIIAGGLLLGVMQAVALAMAGFDEDEPPEFIKERNLVIPLDWVDNLGGPDLDGKYLTIPMPLGLNVIPNTGRVLTEWWMSGFKDTPKRVASITGSFLEMFNPIGNAGWSVQTIAPTFADPLVALSENRDWTGKPIAKEDRSGTDPTPGYTRAKDTASIISKGIAYALNAVSGGTDYKPGVVSPTPDQIDYLIGQVTGGVGREVLKVSQAVESGVTGEDLPTYKIPVAGRFYGDTKELSAVSSRYYDNLTRMNQHENEIKGRAADRVPIGDYFEDNPEARLVFLSNRIEREVSDLRRRKRELIKREASKESIKMAEEAIRRRMQSLNDAIERAQKRTPNNGLNP